MTLRTSKFSPVDYIRREDRIPIAERRPPQGTMLCMVFSMLYGGFVGALVVWLVMA